MSQKNLGIQQEKNVITEINVKFERDSREMNIDGSPMIKAEIKISQISKMKQK